MSSFRFREKDIGIWNKVYLLSQSAICVTSNYDIKNDCIKYIVFTAFYFMTQIVCIP